MATRSAGVVETARGRVCGRAGAYLGIPYAAPPVGDGDCLYLNVWTPRSGGGPWPVLVFLIGGGWTTGWTGSGLDDGAALAEAAQVVVVTFSYRLGSLGRAFGTWARATSSRCWSECSARSARSAATRRG